MLKHWRRGGVSG